jgi:hypothetical protein
MLLSLRDWTTPEEGKTARNLEHENLVWVEAGMFDKTDDDGRILNERFDNNIGQLPI